jgi:hypothetical protein
MEDAPMTPDQPPVGEDADVRAAQPAPAVDPDALRAVARAATPGPWMREGFGVTFHVKQRRPGMSYVVAKGQTRADAAFIAEANPVTVLALLDRLAAAEAQVAAGLALVNEWSADQSLMLPPGWMVRDKCIADLRATLTEQAPE